MSAAVFSLSDCEPPDVVPAEADEAVVPTAGLDGSGVGVVEEADDPSVLPAVALLVEPPVPAVPVEEAPIEDAVPPPVEPAAAGDEPVVPVVLSLSLSVMEFPSDCAIGAVCIGVALRRRS
jgi:hypothetical protein